MSQPLGLAAGNVLEVVEAIETLRGRGPADFWQHCVDVAAEMLLIAGAVASPEAGRVARRWPCPMMGPLWPNRELDRF